MVFQLGGQNCETYVSGKPGEPSRPVQRLSNGQVRLGPPVTRSRPGLFIPPGGGPVIPVPTDTTTPPDEDPTNDPVTTDPTTNDPTLDPCDAQPRPANCGEEPSPGPVDPTTADPTVTDPGPIPSDDTDPVDTDPDPEGGAGSGSNNAPPSLP
jgi:serine/threonine-protein kinase